MKSEIIRSLSIETFNLIKNPNPDRKPFKMIEKDLKHKSEYNYRKDINYSPFSIDIKV
jgi:hypothetical protein